MLKKLLIALLLLAASEANAATVFSSAAGSSFTGALSTGTFSVQASLSANKMLVASVNSGTVTVGAGIAGTGIFGSPTVLSQLDGTPGGAGTYQLDIGNAAISVETITATYNLLNISAIASGTVMIGQALSGASVPTNTSLLGLVSGGDVLAGTCTTAPCVYTVDQSLTVASEAMTGSLCNTAIAISGGGLTVAVTSVSGFHTCVATTGKWEGAVSGGISGYYYTVTPTSTPNNSFGFGVASRSDISGGFTTSSGAFLGGGTAASATAYLNSTGNIYGFGHSIVAGLGSASSGVTGAVVVNLATDPQQIWITLDITGTSGYGGGPTWNGSATSSPEVPGTGRPIVAGDGSGGTGTGAQFFVPDYEIFPVVQLSQSDSATFGFGTNATLDGLIGAGKTYVYNKWDDPTDETAPNPGPTNPQTAVIANAPAYTNNATMTAGNASTSQLASRIVAGPGWNGSAYTTGQPLYLWQALNSGNTSGSGHGTNLQTCASPANTGGIYATSFGGATTAVDGAVTFACLGAVDYVTLTGAFLDDPIHWSNGGTFLVQQVVLNSVGGAYVMNDSSCAVAGASEPVGTTIGTSYSDGTCNWGYLGNITYSSNAHIWPHWKFWNGMEIDFNWKQTFEVFHGGNERQVYQPGQNGEAMPILFWHHVEDTDVYGGLNCQYGYGVTGYAADPGSFQGAAPSCAGNNQGFPWTFTIAPGDSFKDNIDPTVGPLRVDQTKGVLFYSNAAFTTPSPFVTSGEPIGFNDAQGVIERFQELSTAGMCNNGNKHGGVGDNLVNSVLIRDFIVDCAAGYGAFSVDAATTFHNGVVIWRGSAAGSYGLGSAYPIAIYNMTIIGSNATNSTAYNTASAGAGTFAANSAYAMPPFVNNYITGFAHTMSFTYGGGFYGNGEVARLSGWNNATDRAIGYVQPAAPTLTPGSGGSLANGLVYVQVAYHGTGLAGASGAFSVENSATVVAGPSGSIAVTSPPAVAGATSYDVYASSTSALEVLQNGGTPITIGTPYTITALATGTAPASFTDAMGATAHPYMMPGFSATGCNGGASCFSLSASNQLVNPTPGASFDARIKDTSADIYGAGVNFLFSNGAPSYGFASYIGTLMPGSDILGTARPQSGRYDIGASEFLGAPPVTVGGGRRLLR